MTRTYETKNIEQTATIKTVVKIDPEIIFDHTGLATFRFPETPEVTAVVMQFESGIQVDARTLLTVRNQLYRRVRGGRL